MTMGEIFNKRSISYFYFQLFLYRRNQKAINQDVINVRLVVAKGRIEENKAI